MVPVDKLHFHLQPAGNLYSIVYRVPILHSRPWNRDGESKESGIPFLYVVFSVLRLDDTLASDFLANSTVELVEAQRFSPYRVSQKSLPITFEGPRSEQGIF